MELHRLAHLDVIADRDGARVGVGADHAADEEVALARFGAVLVDDHPDLQALGQQFLVPAGQRGGHLAQPRQRRAPAELVDHVALGPGDDERVAHRAAALRDQRVDLGVRQVSADGAAGQHPAVQEQAGLPRPQPAAGHPAHDHGAGHLLVQVGQQAVGRERERVGDHQVHALGFPREPVAAVGAAAGRPDEVHREGLDRAEVGAEPQRDRGLGLDLAGSAGHRLGHAADERERAGLLGDRRDQGLRRAEKVLGGEQHGQFGRVVAEGRARLRHGPARRRGGIRGQDEGCARLHWAAFTGPAFIGPAFTGPAFTGPAFIGPAFTRPGYRALSLISLDGSGPRR